MFSPYRECLFIEQSDTDADEGDINQPLDLEVSTKKKTGLEENYSLGGSVPRISAKKTRIHIIDEKCNPTTTMRERDGLYSMMECIMKTQSEILKKVNSLSKSMSEVKEKLHIMEGNHKPKGLATTVPLGIRNAVHDGFTDGQKYGLEWHVEGLRARDECNLQMTNHIVTFVKEIFPNTDPLVIEVAISRYFRTKKETLSRFKTNKIDKHRRRQKIYERKKEKAKRRLKALDAKDDYSEEFKRKFEAVLLPQFMSSDEEVDQEFITHPLSWESEEFRMLKRELDEKFMSICSTRSKRLMLTRRIGTPVVRTPPDLKESNMWIRSTSEAPTNDS